jgi:uncharacterized protein YjiS (DUF1127 family)
MSASLNGAAAAIWNLAGTAGHGLGRAGRTVVSRIVLARRRRAAIRELEALDDRLLKDIGISRSLIPFLVDGGLSEERPGTGATKRGDIALLPDRQVAGQASREPLSPAA